MLEGRQVKKYDCVMKHRHLMQWTGSLIPVLSLRSTHITAVQGTRETGDINTVLCLIKVNINTIELTVHSSFFCILDILQQSLTGVKKGCFKDKILKTCYFHEISFSNSTK